MKVVLIIVRVVVGLLFIFSGLVKANDPLGLSYKMQEFFDVWGWQSLNDYTLFMALVMNAFEILAGVAVILGWRMRLFSWLLLLLIIFFTFLTGYAVLSGKIHACGCFGDCIPLKPMQSFIKDLILLVLILVIFARRKTIAPLLPSGTCGLIVVLTGVFTIVLQWYVLKHLPIVDCLPYKKGNNLVEKMKVPAGAIPDSIAMVFKYKKDGKIVEFDMAHFPSDINDSTYQFVDRSEKVIREGNAKPAITDFSLSTMSGTDTTQAVLAQPNYYMLFFLKDLSTAKKRWEDPLPGIINLCKQKQIPFFVTTAVADLAKAHLQEIKEINQSDITYLKCDATVIKTAARENPTYVIMKGATVIEKYAAADYDEVVKKLKELK